MARMYSPLVSRKHRPVSLPDGLSSLMRPMVVRSGRLRCQLIIAMDCHSCNFYPLKNVSTLWAFWLNRSSKTNFNITLKAFCHIGTHENDSFSMSEHFPFRNIILLPHRNIFVSRNGNHLNISGVVLQCVWFAVLSVQLCSPRTWSLLWVKPQGRAQSYLNEINDHIFTRHQVVSMTAINDCKRFCERSMKSNSLISLVV